MKIRFSVEGGLSHFPGRAAPFEIATETLASEERAELEAALAEADFFGRPSPAPPPGSLRDHLTYRIEVENAAGQRRAMRVSDPVPPDIRRLVQTLQELARR